MLLLLRHRANAAPPSPPDGLLWQLTARDTTVTRDGSNAVTAWADDYDQIATVTIDASPTYSATGGPDSAPALVYAGAQRISHDGESAGQVNFTLECWGYVDNSSSGASQMFVGSDQDASNYYVNLYPTPNRLSCYLESGRSNAILQDGVNIPFPNAQWVYCVLVKDATVPRFYLYVNGVEVVNANANALPDPTSGYGWQIGNSTLDEPLIGRIHQCAWWSSAASAAEVAARYAAGPRAADGGGF